MSLVIGTVAVVAMRTTSSRLEAVARDLETDMISIYLLRLQAEQLVSTSRGYLLTGDVEKMQRFDAAAARIETTLAEMGKHQDLGPDVTRIRVAVRTYNQAVKNAAQQRIATGDPRMVVSFMESTLGPAHERFEHEIGRLLDREEDKFERASQGARRFAQRAEGIVAVAIGAAVLLSLSLAWIFIRRLNAQYAREREATEIARRAVAARDELLAVVSHDLRTPLQAVTMGANMLDEVATSAAMRRPLAVISAAVERMQHLIDELIDVARLEQHGLELRRERCSGGDLIESAASLFHARAAKAQIEVTCCADAPTSLVVDRERILQVLTNLVSNALRYTPSGGKIAMSVEAANEAVKFAVSDTGPGIPEDQVPHLFDRYWQGGVKKRGSLGLGLYICKQIVDAHGGQLGVATELGRGSTFWFMLPG
ncbi:MAG TPA: HAMP domain-containing sensor histidine kinase [Kofleriaceae bacterium]|nr:HAMP domain-containing sensor histidine kinase [Kofleriaceae bacterium]